MAFEQLRAWKKGEDPEGLGAIERVGDDGFPLLHNSDLKRAHERVTELINNLPVSSFKTEAIVPETWKLTDKDRTELILALLERAFALDANLSRVTGYEGRFSSFFSYGASASIASQLYDAGVDRGLVSQCIIEWFNCYRFNFYSTSLLRRALSWIKNRPVTELTPAEREQLIAIRCQCIDVEYRGSENFYARENQKVHGDLFDAGPIEGIVDAVVGDGLWKTLMPCEVWTRAAMKALEQKADAERATWVKLLIHCQSATGARPSAKWLRAGQELVAAIGPETYKKHILEWFPLVDKGRIAPVLCQSWENVDEQQRMHSLNSTMLRGLVWLSAGFPSAEMIRAIGRLANSSYKKIRGLGPRAVKVGNAAVYALSQMGSLEAVGQLGILQAKVKFGTAQKEIEKAFRAAAADLKVPEDEIQEMAIPTYGLTEVGVAEEKLGEFTARLRVTGTTSTELEWLKADGKAQKGVPGMVKEKFAEELKELKASAKDIERMLPAQRERIDTMFLQEKTWPVGVWRERYLDHPLVGVLARRLLWEFKREGKTQTGIWFNGKVVDLDLREISLDGDATVRLWYPIGKEVEEVMAWREWLDTQQIQQPFKQAHREVYVLTEAELRTRTYSNRFAAHVLKQHQLNALCALRGWKNKLRMMVDAEYPPATLHLPKWGLRAEFWIEGAGTEYGADTNESGAFLRVTTDQVRFYREDAVQRTAHAGGGGYHPGYRGEDAEPLPLEEIPPLVFSEVMRDVDMFVGVASVGNDPTWSDGGPNGQYRTYWGEVSFGALGGSAKTRKEVLERLVPRLKIGKVCSFEERFLVVKGKLRSYKIHLGSGNILMTPNDQYLCIVPKQGVADDGKVLLPFEGDRTLSVILSKAFLLAEDDKIKDETITQQIKNK